jgi:hypothetical protein
MKVLKRALKEHLLRLQRSLKVSENDIQATYRSLKEVPDLL